MSQEDINFMKKVSKRIVLGMVAEGSDTIEMMEKYKDEDNYDICDFINAMYTFLKKHKKAELINIYFDDIKKKRSFLMFSEII